MMEMFGTPDSEDERADRVCLNVSGVKFETYTTTLQNIPDTRLAWMTENTDPETLKNKEFFFDRHPGVFIHILNFYRTGKLHTPTDVCGPLFEEELQFWGIDEKQMEPCCWETFTKHREAEINLKSFEGPGFEDLKIENSRRVSTFSTGGRTILELNFDQVWSILDRPHSSSFARKFSLLSCMMIVISVSFYCLDTMPFLNSKSAWRKVQEATNYVCLAFFTLEFLARIIVTPNRRHFLRQTMNWIDFFSLIPSYLALLFPSHWIRNLVIIRLLRLFRFFKLSYGLQVLLHTLKASSYELTLLLLILLIPVVIFSSLVYFVEYGYDGSNSEFESIPITFWWCLITMTTVGYGDLVPKTWAGQVIGSVCAICGLLIVALPISVIGSNFTLYYAHVRARLKLPKKNRALLQGNLRGLLKQPLSLSSRDRDRRTIKRSNNQAIRRKTEVPLSPNSVKLQLRRIAAFDEISSVGGSTRTSVDKSEKDKTSIPSPSPAEIPTRQRRKPIIAAHFDETDNSDTENAELQSLISRSDGKSRSTERSVSASENGSVTAPRTSLDIALSVPTSNDDLSASKDPTADFEGDQEEQEKETLSIDLLVQDENSVAGSWRSLQVPHSESAQQQDSKSKFLSGSGKFPSRSSSMRSLKSPSSLIKVISKKKISETEDPTDAIFPPVRRSRRGALASRVSLSESDESEGEMFLQTPCHIYNSSVSLPPSVAKSPKRKLSKSISDSQTVSLRHSLNSISTATPKRMSNVVEQTQSIEDQLPENEHDEEKNHFCKTLLPTVSNDSPSPLQKATVLQDTTDTKDNIAPNEHRIEIETTPDSVEDGTLKLSCSSPPYGNLRRTASAQCTRNGQVPRRKKRSSTVAYSSGENGAVPHNLKTQNTSQSTLHAAPSQSDESLSDIVRTNSDLDVRRKFRKIIMQRLYYNSATPDTLKESGV